jgi:hypothetical protein
MPGNPKRQTPKQKRRKWHARFHKAVPGKAYRPRSEDEAEPDSKPGDERPSPRC